MKIGITLDKSEREFLLKEIDDRTDQIVDLLSDLVRIPSVTGEEGQIQLYIAKFLEEEIGLEVDLWESDWEELKKHPEYVSVTRGYDGRPNVVAILKGSGGGKSLLLNGHTDTVPNGPLDSWKFDPLSADISNGRLYGRGSSDMKSGVAAIIMAVKSIVES